MSAGGSPASLPHGDVHRADPGAGVSLWLLRHGETEWSRNGRHTGRTDVPLTDHGREQAVVAGEQLRGQVFAAVRCSPLARARETLELALPGTQASFDDDLQERDYGAGEGITTDDMRRTRPGWNSWTSFTEGAETIDEVGVRADRAIGRAVLAGRPAAERDGSSAVLVVAHGHLLRVLAARWLLQPAGFGAQLVLGTATVSVLGQERDAPALVRWNA